VPRYAKVVAHLGIGKALDIWIVIRIEDMLPMEMESRGWEMGPEYLSDDEVTERYR